MTHSPQPTDRFAQHPRLAELVTALGFRRYPLFLAGLLYEEPGGPLRRATAVASRDGDLLAYDAGEVVELAGRVPTSRVFDDDLTGRSPRPWWTPRTIATRRSSPTRWPAGPGAAAASTRSASSCCATGSWPKGSAPPASTGSEVLEVVRWTSPTPFWTPFRRLADRHQRGFLVEHVIELLATS
jgi:hypothetical protein